MRVRNQCFDDEKTGKKLKNLQLKFLKKYFFDQSLQRLQDLHKGSPSYRRSLHPSNENIQHFKTWKFFTFFVIYALLDPDPDKADQNECGFMRIQIHNTDHDQNFCEDEAQLKT